MQHEIDIKAGIAIMALCAAATITNAQSINQWRGDEVKADWNNSYKWKLQHAPQGDEVIHFRQANSAITVSSTIELDNGMMLYGQDLFLEGNGNINLWSPIPHKSTVCIPASATGYANLTLSDTLTLNGRIALAAKAFGTSASKGSVTLKDRSTIAGSLTIGNNGNGSGQIFIRDHATYRISGLELDTLAKKGGAAEIHILGGTAHLESETKPFDTFLADPSRKIIVGEAGKLRIDSDLPFRRKKELVSSMISQKRIVAAKGCQLLIPIFQDGMILMKAEFSDTPRPAVALVADIRKIPEPRSTNTQKTASAGNKLESLLGNVNSKIQPKNVAKTPENNTGTDAPGETADKDAPPLGGYIVFLSAILLLLRPAGQSKE